MISLSITEEDIGLVVRKDLNIHIGNFKDRDTAIKGLYHYFYKKGIEVTGIDLEKGYATTKYSYLKLKVQEK